MKMNIWVLILVFIVLAKETYTRDASWVHFIKSYVENEGKPTILILSDLCWGKRMYN